MNRTLIAAGAMLLACSLQACAPQPVKQQATTAPAKTAQTVQTARAARREDCIEKTGSHISSSKGECLNVPGRSYTREDLERTGLGSTGAALNRARP